MLQAELNEIKNENEQLTKKCHTLNAQRDAALGMLKDSEKRQRDLDSKSKEITAEIENLQKQFITERELKQKLEKDAEKLREDNRKSEEYRQKLEEENERLQEEKAKVEKENERLKAQNEVLNYQADQQRESSLEMHRSYSDLTGKYRRMQRQHNSKSDSEVVAGKAPQTSVQAITPLQEQSDNNSVGNTRTTTQSIQAMTCSQQQVQSQFQDNSPESNSDIIQ